MKKNAELPPHSPFFVTDANQLEKLRKNSGIHVCDEIDSQLRELIKLQNPTKRLSEEEYHELIKIELKGQKKEEYGEWVYYAWNNTLVHLLKEKEFIEVRTNRNQYKITPAERDELAKKKIGVVGLSVGQSIAVTAAIERICGEIRLADFDVLELSNLNRIRSGLQNLGIPKVIIAAREIAEIDPYIQVKLFPDGLTEENIDDFFSGGGQLDLFVEVCDGLDMKVISRYKAKELRIPVVMDTNDRGMMDIERFDLEPDRPVLHGLADELNPKSIKELTNEQKVPYVLKMISADQISTRMKASMFEIEQSITTWPQLASSVVLGGALTVDVSRRILLDQYHESGRYYVDIEEQIGDRAPKKELNDSQAQKELTKNEQLEMVKEFPLPENSLELNPDQLSEIWKAIDEIPSSLSGYSPIKVLHHHAQVFLFIDQNLVPSFLNANNLSAYSMIGSIIETIVTKGASMGIDVHIHNLPETNEQALIAVLSFHEARSTSSSSPKIIRQGKASLAQLQERLKEDLNNYPGSELQLTEDRDLMTKLDAILSKAQALFYTHPEGYHDIFVKKGTWNNSDEPKTKFEAYITSSEKNDKSLNVYKLYSDSKVNEFLRKLEGGNALKKLNQQKLSGSPAFGIITMPSFSAPDKILGGRLFEHFNLIVKLNGLCLKPSPELLFILEKLKKDTLANELDRDFEHSLEKIKTDFYALFPYLANRHLISIFRIFSEKQ